MKLCFILDTSVGQVLTPTIKLTFPLYCTGKLNPNANQVGMWALSQSGCEKLVPNRRSLRVWGLFGGKKENNEKSDDAPSKVHTDDFHL